MYKCSTWTAANRAAVRSTICDRFYFMVSRDLFAYRVKVYADGSATVAFAQIGSEQLYLGKGRSTPRPSWS